MLGKNDLTEYLALLGFFIARRKGAVLGFPEEGLQHLPGIPFLDR